MKRNYSLDLLRMILMLMVVILHVISKGGILSNVTEFSANYNAVWFLETLAYCAVNCYALISGYVYFNSRYRFSSLLQICLQALFYSVSISVVVWIVKPGTFNLRDLIEAFLPVLREKYWYLTAYVGLFVLIPFLNAGVNAFSSKQAKTYLILTFFVFTVLPVIARREALFIQTSYRPVWLAFMYVVGANIKKHGWGERVKPRSAALIFLGCVFISWFMSIFSQTITLHLLGSPKALFALIAYNSPTMVIAAVALFYMFKNLRFSPRLVWLVSEFSPAAFGVYLIHEHNYIVKFLIQDKFVFLSDHSIPQMLLGILLIALIIFTVCLLIDWLRCKLFKCLHIKEFFNKLEEKYIRYNVTTIDE